MQCGKPKFRPCWWHRVGRRRRPLRRHEADHYQGWRRRGLRQGEALERARQDHLDMVKALRGSHRDKLVALTRRHLQPAPESYIRDYERGFGKTDPS